jgi:hypothetical protein
MGANHQLISTRLMGHSEIGTLAERSRSPVVEERRDRPRWPTDPLTCTSEQEHNGKRLQNSSFDTPFHELGQSPTR